MATHAVLNESSTGLPAVIMAGGRGTRLAPFTSVLPKPLMPLGEKPILDTLLRQLAAQGVTEVTIAIGYLGDLIRSYCGDGERYGLELRYSPEESPLGTAGPLSAMDHLTSTFLMMNGDLLTTLRVGDLIDTHRRAGGIGTIAITRRDIELEFGVIETSSGAAGTSRIREMREKPTVTSLVSMGFYVFEPEVRDHIGHDERLDLPDLVERLLEAGETVAVHEFDGYWLDIGRHSDYERALDEFEQLRPHLVPDPKGSARRRRRGVAAAGRTKR